jgi:hypothetical protein
VASSAPSYDWSCANLAGVDAEFAAEVALKGPINVSVDNTASIDPLTRSSAICCAVLPLAT